MSGPQVRPEISRLLAQLQARIRRYVFLEGTASVVAVIGLLFWLSLGLDWVYFRIQRAELPREVRFTVTIAGIAFVVGALFLWVAVRTLRTFRERALALVLERRFPELKDRLITAIELGEAREGDALLTTAMVQRTAGEVADLSSRLRLGQVFDVRPLVRAVLLAVALATSIAGFAIYFGDVFQTWYRRNLLLANEPWRRETALRVYVLADPNERVVEFRNGAYKHPRGGDLTVVAEVLDGKMVPDKVEFRYRDVDGKSGRSYFARIGTNQFKHTLSRVLGSLEFTILAGDAERPSYHVEVVEPPRVDRIVLRARYPEYTALNEVDPFTGVPRRTERPVQGAQIALPAGTDFILQAFANKPLLGVKVQTEKFNLELDRGQATLTLFQGEGGQQQGGSFVVPQQEPWLAADGRSFAIPYLLAGPAEQDVIVEGRVQLPLRLPADSVFRIDLSDADGIHSSESSRLSIGAIVDEPPLIETRLRGIGSSITRKALIPVAGTIRDDYGVAAVRFEYRIDDVPEFQTRALGNPPPGTTEFKLQSGADREFERFEVLPLELQVKQKLTLAVSAADGDNILGPHVTQGERYVFEIVTEEELLSILYSRELNLRHRFEQILEEMKAIQVDLTSQRDRLAVQPAPTETIELAAAASIRALSGVRKDHNESQAIEQAFGDIREEMVNNSVESADSLARIDDKLLKPLHVINEIDFNEVDQALGLFGLALEEHRDSIPALDDGLRHMTRLIEHMEAVLYEMRRLETFKELVELLKAIKNQQDELRLKTEAERKRQLIEDLK